jgi:hypothetical protein
MSGEFRFFDRCDNITIPDYYSRIQYIDQDDYRMIRPIEWSYGVNRVGDWEPFDVRGLNIIEFFYQFGYDSRPVVDMIQHMGNTYLSMDRRLIENIMFYPNELIRVRGRVYDDTTTRMLAQVLTNDLAHLINNNRL